jgi:hypothetical protein
MSWRKIDKSESGISRKKSRFSRKFMHFSGTLTKHSASESEWAICAGETVDSLRSWH